MQMLALRQSEQGARMTDRELLEEALHQLSQTLGYSDEAQERLNDLKRRIRKRLEEPEGEWRKDWNNDVGPDDDYYIEWFEVRNGDRRYKCDEEEDADYLVSLLNGREWVELTSDEGAEIWADCHDIEWKRLVPPKEIVKRISDKLKEKNR